MFSAFDVLLEETAKTLGSRLPREDSLREKMEKVLNERLEAWKAKIDEGVSKNQEIIVVEDEISVRHMRAIQKRSRPSEASTSNAPPPAKRTKTASNQAPPPPPAKKSVTANNQPPPPPPAENIEDDAMAALAAAGLGGGLPGASQKSQKKGRKGKGKQVPSTQRSELLFEEPLDIQCSISALGKSGICFLPLVCWLILTDILFFRAL